MNYHDFWNCGRGFALAYVHSYPGKPKNRGTHKHHAARVQRSKAKLK